jgi:hypothetical protein
VAIKTVVTANKSSTSHCFPELTAQVQTPLSTIEGSSQSSHQLSPIEAITFASSTIKIFWFCLFFFKAFVNTVLPACYGIAMV